MLEVVRVDLAAVYNIVWLNIICIFLDINRDILFLKNIGDNCKDLCVRRGRSRNGDRLTLELAVINICGITIGRVFHYAYNGTVIFLIDKIHDLLTFESSLQSKYLRLVLAAFFYNEDVSVSGSGAFDSERILYGIDARFDSVIRVDDCVINVLQNVRHLSRLDLLERDVLGIIGDVCRGGGNACVRVELYVTEVIEQKKRSCLIRSVVGNSYLYTLGA